MPRPTRPPIGLQLATTAKAVGRAFDNTMAAAGGSVPIWLILISLKTREIANQRELASVVGIQGATLTHHLNAMEADGLITRRRDPANRRIHQVRMTERGEQLFHRLAAAAQEHDERLRAGLDEDEIATLERLFAVLRGNVATDRPGEDA